MIEVSKAAHRKLAEHLEHAPEGAGIRIAVLPGGCSGFQYGLDVEGRADGDDCVVERSGIRFFVDPFSAQYLDGVHLDYVRTTMGEGFSFQNPNAAGGCGCGSSFTV